MGNIKTITYQSVTKTGYKVITNMTDTDLYDMYTHDKGLYDYIFFG